MKEKYIHLRYPDPRDPAKPSGKGGLTICYQVDGDEVHYAEAQCHMKDNFSRRKGRLISSGRLHKGKSFVFHGNEEKFGKKLIARIPGVTCYSR